MVDVNWIAIVIAAVAATVLGFIWYSPAVLGKPWMKEKGYTPESLKALQKEAGMWYVVSFILALVTAYVLNHVIVLSLNFFHYAALNTGLISAFWMWLGFMMPVQATATLFGNKNFKLLAIDSGYQLVSILAMGAVIGFMR